MSILLMYHFLVFPDSSVGKEFVCNAGDPCLIPGLGKIHWRRDRLPTPAFWPREFHGWNGPKSWILYKWFSLSMYHFNIFSTTLSSSLIVFKTFVLKSFSRLPSDHFRYNLCCCCCCFPSLNGLHFPIFCMLCDFFFFLDGHFTSKVQFTDNLKQPCFT